MTERELRQMFVLASSFKEGDLAVGGTHDEQLRGEARHALAGLRVGDIARVPLVADGVSDALARSLHADRASSVGQLTIGEIRNLLLGADAPHWAAAYAAALPSEAIAALAKVMSDDELSRVARATSNPLPGDGITIGSSLHLGSRIQPNSPGDDEVEILFSILEGLACGCGDVILGLNPASDDVDTIVRLEELLRAVVERLGLPTRYCVLSDLVKQQRARERTRVDVGFQSLAGTSAALTGMLGVDVDGVQDLARGFEGLYFETGQGSEVTNGAAEAVDMATLEARTYGVARLLRRQTGVWTIVNDVAGFIGPEVFRTPAQLERACLEDVVMARLHGLTMGLDVCATFHMGISPSALRAVTDRVVARAAPAYLMAVAGNADPMLGYLTTAFRDHPRLRRRHGRRITSAMQRWRTAVGLDAFEAGAVETTAHLFALYARAGGDRRAIATLADEGQRRLLELQMRGFDLGYGCGTDAAPPAEAERRSSAIYEHARRALYAAVDEHVMANVSPRHARVRTLAVDRDDYIAHPPVGERLRPADADRVARLHSGRRAHVQFVVSDGLNANAVNEQLPALLPPLRRSLAAAGHVVGDIDLFVEHGRVRAGYHLGSLLDTDVIVHLIGERPGTGLNTLSAYLTYGRDAAGHRRWRPELDHSCTTAICGIHARGTPPADAAVEIARTVGRILAERRSGVALHACHS